jgi:hypothetical protein
MNLAYDLDIKGSEESKNFCKNFLKFTGIDDKPNGQGSTYYHAQFKGYEFFDSTKVFQFDDGTHGTYNVSDPDGIKPVGGSYQVLVLDGVDPYISCAGVSYVGNFPGGSAPGKVFTTTIPFESILGETERIEFMSEVIRFFNECCVSIEPWTLPSVTAFLKPYPNPFNPRVVIPYILAKNGHVNLTVYDILGRRVEVLIDCFLEKGKYEVTWSGEGYSAGLYLCRLETNGSIKGTEKILLLK